MDGNLSKMIDIVPIFDSIDTYLNVILEVEDETARLVGQLFPFDNGRVDVIAQPVDLVAMILSLWKRFINIVVQSVVREQRFHRLLYDASHVVQLYRVFFRVVLSDREWLRCVVQGF